MPHLGPTSLARLATCHPKLRAIVMYAISHTETDFAVVCGWRNQHDQDEAFATGMSGVAWPDSAHNHTLLDGTPYSAAVDLCPWSEAEHRLEWEWDAGFSIIANAMIAAAASLNVKLVHWPITYVTANGKRVSDLPHFELVPEEYAA